MNQIEAMTQTGATYLDRLKGEGIWPRQVLPKAQGVLTAEPAVADKPLQRAAQRILCPRVGQ